MDQRIEPVGACPFSAGESEHLVFQLEEMANMMHPARLIELSHRPGSMLLGQPCMDQPYRPARSSLLQDLTHQLTALIGFSQNTVGIMAFGQLHHAPRP